MLPSSSQPPTFLDNFTLSGFSPEGGDETSIIEISGNGFLDVTGVKFDQFSSSFSISAMAALSLAKTMFAIAQSFEYFFFPPDWSSKHI